MRRIVLVLISLMSISLMMSAKVTVTEEDDIKNITEFVKKEYYNYTSFKVEPLYNEKDEREYYLVEFEPTSFIFVQPKYNTASSCYPPVDYNINEISNWEKYKCEVQINPYTNKKECKKVYIPDENGEYVRYHDTPYKVAGYENAKKYLIKHGKQEELYSYIIPAVKIGDKFLNLVSMEEFTISDLETQEFMAGFDNSFSVGTYNCL